MFTINNENHSYVADEVISSGKFGPVWVGHCVETNQKVIIKEYSEKQIELATKLAAINHPLLHTGRLAYSSEKAYIVRNYVEGSNLKELLSNRWQWGKLSIEFWIKAVINLLDGLQAFHEKGLVHRDVKPSNIVIGHGHQPVKNWLPENMKLVDFEQSLILSSTDREQRTPFALGYAPPEQLLNRNKLTDQRSDIFSVGVTLYEVLTRDKAFLFFDPEIMLHIQLNTPILNKGGVDENLFKIILKATQKEPFRLPPSRLPIDETDAIIKRGMDKRYPTAAEMADDLKGWLSNNNTKKIKKSRGFWVR